MEEGIVLNRGDDLLNLPPGFRFHPTDEEIITHYLTEKVMNCSFSASAVGEVDMNKCEPWDLPKKAKMPEKEWYFFFQRDRKYPTGMRTNRATESGYWKATGKDKEIYKGKGCLVGMKKTLVFYRGRAPKGEKTNWVMHEYRLEGKFSYYNLPKSAKVEWVVCRVFHKNSSTGGLKKSPIHEMSRVNSFGDDHFLDRSTLPPLMEPPCSTGTSSGFGHGENEFKSINTASLSRFSDGNYLQNFVQPQNSNYQTTPNSIYTQVPEIFSSFHGSPNLGYFYQGRSSVSGSGYSAINDKHCKVEQFSLNQSMVSLLQETEISTDVNTNTEISSVVSGYSKKGYEDLEGPSVGPIADLDCFWD